MPAASNPKTNLSDIFSSSRTSSHRRFPFAYDPTLLRPAALRNPKKHQTSVMRGYVRTVHAKIRHGKLRQITFPSLCDVKSWLEFRSPRDGLGQDMVRSKMSTLPVDLPTCRHLRLTLFCQESSLDPQTAAHYQNNGNTVRKKEIRSLEA